MNHSVYHVGWDEVTDLVNIIACNIEASGQNIDYIYGVPRGGLVPAVMLSHRLGVPLIHELDDKQVLGKTLIVDDIYDTGRTMKEHIKNKLSTRVGCCLYKKASSPQVFGLQITPSQTWYQFPWEI